MTAADSSALNFWSWLYTIGAWLVVVGVVMEGAEILARRQHVRWLRKFIGPLPQTLSDPTDKHWVHTIGDIGFSVLVAALFIEQVCHHRIEEITGREQRRLTEQLEATTKLAGEANKEAGEARLSASITESNNLVLRLDLAALELKLQPRVVMDSQVTSFIDALKDASKKPVWVLHSGDSEDAAPLAIRIRQMLDSAGYNASGRVPDGIYGWEGGGIVVSAGAMIKMEGVPGAFVLIWINSDDFRPGKIPPAADALENAFVAAGITALIQPVNALKSGDVLVAIPNRKRF